MVVLLNIELENQGLLKFQFMCKSFYRNFYNFSSYDEWINGTKLPKSSSGRSCFIVTATMGNYNHPVVIDLRQFRNDWLLKRNLGKTFVNWYYIHGEK